MEQPNIPEGSETNLKTFKGKHSWSIKGWKNWMSCSENLEKTTLYSDTFTVPVDYGDQDNIQTKWQIKAFLKHDPQQKKEYLAFRLVSLNEVTPRGTFHFESKCWGILCGVTTHTRFAALPLDAANKWATCIRMHPSEDLIMCVKIKIVVAEGDTFGLPVQRGLDVPPLYESVVAEEEGGVQEETETAPEGVQEDSETAPVAQERRILYNVADEIVAESEEQHVVNNEADEGSNSANMRNATEPPLKRRKAD